MTPTTPTAARGRFDDMVAPVAATDVHVGLIPLDPTRNAEHVEPRHRRHTTTSQHLSVMTHGDSWVEWGHPRTYDPDHADRTGRQYGAPGLHVVVRFPPMDAPVGDDVFPADYVAEDRRDHLAGLARRVVAEEFADLLADGHRFSDYAVVTDAEDWFRHPAWLPREVQGRDKEVGFYC